MEEESFRTENGFLLVQSDGCSVYQFRNDTGDGTMTCYEIFPGAMLSFNDFHVAHFDSAYVPGRNMFVIDHCREGKMEYLAAENAYAYVSAGDIKMDRRLTHTGRFIFPSSHYHGLTIAFDMEIAASALSKEVKDFPIDLTALQQKYCPGRYPHVIREMGAAEHIFGELYPGAERSRDCRAGRLRQCQQIRNRFPQNHGNVPVRIPQRHLLKKESCVKVLCFAGSTGASHQVAYHVLVGLRLKLADRFLHAPLWDVQSHSIGEIKNVLVDKIEGIEPPLAHVVPEGAGHIVLPVISIIALALTFQISGKNFDTYNKSNAYMNSTIVEYIEGIEVIKAFGRAGVSYEKYSKAITDYRTFVIKWLSSTWVTMKLAFALFPTTLP